MAGCAALSDVNFLSLQSAVFCAQCELISQNTTPYCLACGSQAVLSLSRVLGGSLKNQQTAHLIADAELDRLVRELLRTVPRAATTEPFQSRRPALGGSFEQRDASAVPSPTHATAGTTVCQAPEICPEEMDLEPGISIIAERAQTLTGATGAAIALRNGSDIVCRARTGRTAPDLGVRLQKSFGLSAECVRKGEVLLCHDAESNPQVDIASCRRLGARSILVAPLRHFRQTLGVFEVLSAAPYAFDHHDIATMQLLSSMMVAAMSRLSTIRQSWK
ncbi:MAG TPA: GAF domain-containing protein [Terriglobales bacterium]|nr:GAF domain-containing protein [Terriglobales bacterium]